MKKFLTSLKRQDGFTLVELMVVVAIIGLLSAVAVPNFKKYQAKAKVAEAKLQLANAWTAEQAFFVDYSIYHTCLSNMGFGWPAAENASHFYAVGFNTAAATTPALHNAALLAGLDPACTATLAATNLITYYLAGKGAGGAFANAVGFLPASSVPAASATFTVGAAGVIDSAFITAANSSALTMNELKAITSVAGRQGF